MLYNEKDKEKIILYNSTSILICFLQIWIIIKNFLYILSIELLLKLLLACAIASENAQMSFTT